jgi:hypothetical protein
MTTAKEELAALKREVEELKAAQPKPELSAEDRERRAREWASEMHALREGNMRYAMPPSVVRDMAVLDDNLVKAVTLRDARAPTSPSSAIPGSQQGTRVGVPSSTPGWSEPTPLGPPPGIRWVDAQLIADDVKQRNKDKP